MYVHNYSSLELSGTLFEVLSLGPKFCIPSAKTSQLELETRFESLSDQLSGLAPTSETNIASLKSTLVNTCYQYLQYKSKGKRLLTNDHLDALKNLQNNDDILISRPDKGTGIVLMNRKDYIDKMNALLSDTTKFKKMDMEKDKTAQIEKSLTRLIRQLKQKQLIDSSDFDRIRPTGTTFPRLYGLPKIHKEGVPLRPILDMSNSPYHALAKWLARKLEPIRRRICKYSLQDTFDFIENIKDLNTRGQQLFSLDVASLFTSVPLQETIDYLCEYIDKYQLDVGVPTEDLKKLLLACTFNVQFLVNQQIYRQKDGVAMGSPLGPLLADVFMEKLENETLGQTIAKFTAYKRYVDDILSLCTTELNLDDTLSAFNSAHPNIRITYEKEEEGQISFLDVRLIKREDGSIQRSVYRKGTWNGQYIHFESFAPMKQKRNLIRCLTFGRCESVWKTH